MAKVISFDPSLRWQEKFDEGLLESFRDLEQQHSEKRATKVAEPAADPVADHYRLVQERLETQVRPASYTPHQDEVRRLSTLEFS